MRLRPLLAIPLLVLTLTPATAVAGGGCHGTFLDGQATVVETKMACFTPAVTRVEIGDTVVWRNTDGLPHNVTTSAGFGGELPPKSSYSHRFTQPGVYPYSCTLHPGMVGAVVVGDGIPAADAAVTPADLTSAATPDAGAGSTGWILAGALALLLGLSLTSGRIRRQRPDGSAAS